MARIICSQWLCTTRQKSPKSKGRQYDLTSRFIIGSINNAVFTVGIKEKGKHTLGVEINTVYYMLISLGVFLCLLLGDHLSAVIDQ